MTPSNPIRYGDDPFTQHWKGQVAEAEMKLERQRQETKRYERELRKREAKARSKPADVPPPQAKKGTSAFDVFCYIVVFYILMAVFGGKSEDPKPAKPQAGKAVASTTVKSPPPVVTVNVEKR